MTTFIDKRIKASRFLRSDDLGCDVKGCDVKGWNAMWRDAM